MNLTLWNAMTQAVDTYHCHTFSALPFIVGSAPLLGRFAFAAVFALLILWLIWIPATRLQGSQGDDEPKGPSVKAVRLSAIAIAAIQIALYLFWG